VFDEVERHWHGNVILALSALQNKILFLYESLLQASLELNALSFKVSLFPPATEGLRRLQVNVKHLPAEIQLLVFTNLTSATEVAEESIPSNVSRLQSFVLVDSEQQGI